MRNNELKEYIKNWCTENNYFNANGDLSDHVAYDVANDMKADIEESSFNTLKELEEDYHQAFDHWYDLFVEDDMLPYLYEFGAISEDEVEVFTLEYGVLLDAETAKAEGFDRRCSNEITFFDLNDAYAEFLKILSKDISCYPNKYYELYSGKMEINAEIAKSINNDCCVADPPKTTLIIEMTMKNRR